jgi:hypothetical protein
MKTLGIELSVVLPAYDEEEDIAESLKRFLRLDIHLE